MQKKCQFDLFFMNLWFYLYGLFTRNGYAWKAFA